jgi:hypothetical protein
MREEAVPGKLVIQDVIPPATGAICGLTSIAGAAIEDVASRRLALDNYALAC